MVTHYHADHTHGLGGLTRDRPEGADSIRMLTTSATRQRLAANEEPVLPDAEIADEGEDYEIDLGDRQVRVVSRLGHTSSDVTIHLEQPDVIWCGDLVWNGMFPNYVDAIPSNLTHHCEAILGRKETTYVPGHGNLGDAAALAPYLALVRDLETAGRRAIESGTPAVDAAAEYTLPESIRDWVMFSPNYVERAFSAWERELAGARVKETTRK